MPDATTFLDRSLFPDDGTLEPLGPQYLPWPEQTHVRLGATFADATGLSHQEHLFYAVNSARWWLVYVDSIDQTKLWYAWSTDLLTWTDSGFITLTQYLRVPSVQSDGVGTNLSVRYRDLSGTDVVHLGFGFKLANNNHRHSRLRATIAGDAWTVTNVEATVTSSSITYDYNGEGSAVGFDSSGFVYHALAYGGGLGEFQLSENATADTGTSWTPGSWANRSGAAGPVSVTCKSQTVLDLGGGSVLHVGDNGASDGGAQTAVNWAKWNGTTYTAGGTPPDKASVGFAAGSFDFRDWGAVARTTTDIHAVKRTGSNTYEHRRFDGSAWAAGQAIPTQASKAGAGVFLCSDGTDVWLFVIDSDAANTVRYVKWSSAGASWGSWTAFETSTATRTALSGYRVKGADNNLGICWTEAANPFVVVTKPLALAAGTNAPAEAAAISWPALDALQTVAPVAEAASQTVDGQDLAPLVAPVADAAPGTWSALDPGSNAAPVAEAAAVAWAALDGGGSVAVQAECASYTVTAQDATVLVGTLAQAEAAAISWPALDPTTTVATGSEAAAVGQAAGDPTLKVAPVAEAAGTTLVAGDPGGSGSTGPTEASYTFTAQDARQAVAPVPDTAPITWSALDATASTSGNTLANAEAAAWTLAAQDPGGGVATTAEVAPITWAAGDPGVGIGRNASAEVAAIAWAAHDPGSNAATGPTTATWTLAALDPFASLGSSVFPPEAAWTIAGLDAAGRVAPVTEAALIAWSALDATVTAIISTLRIRTAGREPLSAISGREPAMIVSGKEPSMQISGREQGTP